MCVFEYLVKCEISSVGFVVTHFVLHQFCSAGKIMLMQGTDQDAIR